jgi:hypothetical protein
LQGYAQFHTFIFVLVCVTCAPYVVITCDCSKQVATPWWYSDSAIRGQPRNRSIPGRAARFSPFILSSNGTCLAFRGWVPAAFSPRVKWPGREVDHFHLLPKLRSTAVLTLPHVPLSLQFEGTPGRSGLIIAPSSSNIEVKQSLCRPVTGL